MKRRSRQQELPFELKRKRKRRRGSKLGRPPRAERLGFVSHGARPAHDRRHPVHVSMKRVRLAPDLRAESVHAALVSEIAAAVRRGVRVLHYSVQSDHLHLLVEAEDRVKLARGMQLLFSRIAFAVNRLARRHGSLFRDRHHRHELKTPTEVRRSLVYVLFNSRKHKLEKVLTVEGGLDWIDERSSVVWFEDWDPRARPPPDQAAGKRARAGPPPLSAPQTWLARTGWQRAGGLIRFDEMPKVHFR